MVDSIINLFIEETNARFTHDQADIKQTPSNHQTYV